MKTTLSAARRARGVSLVEALVALAVMAFGMLGVVGMQSTLRNGADQSKQRSEALRLAQEKMETLRGFAVLDGAPSGELDYADIQPELPASAATTATAGYANATFMRSVTVVDPTVAASSALRMKHVTVAVTWADRDSDGTTATERRVELKSSIAQIAPELGAGLGLSTSNSAPRRPDGRHVSVPPQALNQGTTSLFTVPGSGGVTWTFSNALGLITQVCPTSGPCSNVGYALLAGFVRFATGAQATSAEAENPADPAVPVSVWVIPTAPGTTRVDCYASIPTGANYVQYFCAMPLIDPASLVLPDFTWSGTSYVEVTGGTLASSATDATAGRYKVCRYTPDATTDTPAGGNTSHPRVYTTVPASLVNQNFLIIDAGTGTTNFTCPTDDTGTPLIDGDTRLHQPAP